MNYDWNFSILNDPIYVKALMEGLWTTITLTFWGIFWGTPLGVLLGSMACLGGHAGPAFSELSAARRRCSVWRRRALASIRFLTVIWIDAIRAIPLLCLILLCYYAIPHLMTGPAFRWLVFALGLNPKSPVTAYHTTVVALAVNLSAFFADLVRGAAPGVPRSSVLAGRSLGMTPRLVWRRIILPDIARQILPGVSMLYITIAKMTTLASAVAVYEILHTADAIIQAKYRPLELYLVVCVLFVALIMPLSFLARRLERTALFVRRSS